MAEPLKINSPIDDSLVGEVPAMSRDEVDAAIARVRSGQAAWAQQRIAERATVVRGLAATLREAAEPLADLLIKEIGKTTDEAKSEVVRSVDLIEFSADEAERLKDYEHKAEEFPNTEAGRVQRVTRVPHGVVLAIPPFNYPINLSVSKIAPALLMGNTVVFKPPRQGAVSAVAMVEAWREAGLPTELLAVVTGDTSEIGDYLVQHDGIDAINLTGSDTVGRQVAEITTMKPLLLELGGNDAAIVLDDADLELAAKHIAGGAFKYAGQRCTAVKRVYAEASIVDQLVTRLVTARNEQFGSAGDPREHPVGPVISDRQADYLEELLDDAKAKGGEVHCGGTRKGRFWEATVVSNVPHEARLVTEEQFGPILPIVPVKDADEAVAKANDSRYGLQASVFTADTKGAVRIADRLQAGGVHLNGPDQRGPDNFLFIGHKASGFGAQGVRYSLEAMSLPKAVIHN